jgi:hypothetical protein
MIKQARRERTRYDIVRIAGIAMKDVIDKLAISPSPFFGDSSIARDQQPGLVSEP